MRGGTAATLNDDELEADIVERVLMLTALNPQKYSKLYSAVSATVSTVDAVRNANPGWSAKNRAMRALKGKLRREKTRAEATQQRARVQRQTTRRKVAERYASGSDSPDAGADITTTTPVAVTRTTTSIIDPAAAARDARQKAPMATLIFEDAPASAAEIAAAAALKTAQKERALEAQAARRTRFFSRREGKGVWKQSAEVVDGSAATVEAESALAAAALQVGALNQQSVDAVAQQQKAEVAALVAAAKTRRRNLKQKQRRAGEFATFDADSNSGALGKAHTSDPPEASFAIGPNSVLSREPWTAERKAQSVAKRTAKTAGRVERKRREETHEVATRGEANVFKLHPELLDGPNELSLVAAPATQLHPNYIAAYDADRNAYVEVGRQTKSKHWYRRRGIVPPAAPSSNDPQWRGPFLQEFDVGTGAATTTTREAKASPRPTRNRTRNRAVKEKFAEFHREREQRMQQQREISAAIDAEHRFGKDGRKHFKDEYVEIFGIEAWNDAEMHQPHGEEACTKAGYLRRHAKRLDSASLDPTSASYRLVRTLLINEWRIAPHFTPEVDEGEAWAATLRAYDIANPPTPQPLPAFRKAPEREMVWAEQEYRLRTTHFPGVLVEGEVVGRHGLHKPPTAETTRKLGLRADLERKLLYPSDIARRYLPSNEVDFSARTVEEEEEDAAGGVQAFDPSSTAGRRVTIDGFGGTHSEFLAEFGSLAGLGKWAQALPPPSAEGLREALDDGFVGTHSDFLGKYGSLSGLGQWARAVSPEEVWEEEEDEEVPERVGAGDARRNAREQMRAGVVLKVAEPPPSNAWAFDETTKPEKWNLFRDTENVDAIAKVDTARIKLKRELDLDRYSTSISGTLDFTTVEYAGLAPHALAEAMHHASRRSRYDTNHLKTVHIPDFSEIAQGELVEANFARNGRWLAAKVTFVSRTGHYDLRYTDGRVERNVRSDVVRRKNKKKAGSAHRAVVDARFSNSRWLAATELGDRERARSASPRSKSPTRSVSPTRSASPARSASPQRLVSPQISLSPTRFGRFK